MVFNGTFEMRSLPYLALEDVSVLANETICEITGDIENNGVTFASFQICMSSAGKLFSVDENGNSMYLTDPNNDWPSGYQALCTIMIPQGKTVQIKFSADATLYNMIVVLGGSVF
jgi:hypothetical protein